MGFLLFALALISFVVVFGAVLIVLNVKISQQFWKKKNIYTLKTSVPILGHLGNMILRKESLAAVVNVTITKKLR